MHDGRSPMPRQAAPAPRPPRSGPAGALPRSRGSPLANRPRVPVEAAPKRAVDTSKHRQVERGLSSPHCTGSRQPRRCRLRPPIAPRGAQLGEHGGPARSLWQGVSERRQLSLSVGSLRARFVAFARCVRQPLAQGGRFVNGSLGHLERLVGCRDGLVDQVGGQEPRRWLSRPCSTCLSRTTPESPQ